MLAVFSVIIILVQCTVVSQAIPSKRYDVFPYYDPVLDASEFLATSSEDDPPYVPLFPNGYNDDTSSTHHLDNSMSQVETPEIQVTSDVETAGSSSGHQYNAYYNLVDQLPHLQLDGLHTKDTFVETNIDKKEASRAKDIKMRARRAFIDTASAMKIDLGMPTLLRRFRDFNTPILIEDFLSNDTRRKEMATGTILMHRPTALRFFDQYYASQLPTEPIYQGHTKEDVLARIFSIMGVAPAEDVRLWWYDRIIHHSRNDTLPDLYSNDRARQEAAISYISGLSRKGPLWIKNRYKQTIEDHMTE